MKAPKGKSTPKMLRSLPVPLIRSKEFSACLPAWRFVELLPPFAVVSWNPHLCKWHLQESLPSDASALKFCRRSTTSQQTSLRCTMVWKHSSQEVQLNGRGIYTRGLFLSPNDGRPMWLIVQYLRKASFQIPSTVITD